MSKRLITTLTLLLSSFALLAEEKQENEKKVALEALDIDKVSETLGHLIVRHLENPGFKFNIEKIVSGIKDEMAGKPSPMSEEEYEQAIAEVQENIFLKLSEKNLENANAFLEKNGKEEGIVSLNPKLQYKVLQAGEGKEVNIDSTPLVHYVGKLLDGSVFSSSLEGKPLALPIKQTIPGFSEGLLGMKKGEKRLLYIHPELAYGVGGHLPPNSLLIFEVEILETEAKTAEVEGKGANEVAQDPQASEKKVQ